MTALGASAGLAAVNVRYRDIRYVVPFATQMWLFLTPIVYPSSSLSEPLRTISAINPMAGWSKASAGRCSTRAARRLT